MVFIIDRHFTKTASSGLLKGQKMAVGGAFWPFMPERNKEKADGTD